MEDKHGRVRMEAFVAASWLPKQTALPLLALAKKHPLDPWMDKPYEIAVAHASGVNVVKNKEAALVSTLKGKDLELYTAGQKLYAKDGYCTTCHQTNGKGLPSSGFPPLSNSIWVTGNQERLIKLVIKGIMGPMELNGVKYAGQVPMTPYGGLMSDKEIASVLTYIRNSFGNKATAIDPEKVKEVRAKIASKQDLYNANMLLSEHPIEK